MVSDFPPGWRPRRLFIERRHGDHYHWVFLGGGMGAIGLGFLLIIVSATTRPVADRITALGVGLPVVWGFLPIFYCLTGLRGTIWEDGFRPTSTFGGLKPTTFFRHGLRAKLRWGEIQRVTLIIDPRRATPTGVKVLLSAFEELSWNLRDSDDPSVAQFALLFIERWKALGGSVEVEATHL